MRIFLGMFNEKNRPFFQSAQLYELKKLPHDDLVKYLMDQFKKSGKRCPQKNAVKISLLSQQNPYYAQKLALNVYEVAGKVIHEQDISGALELMIDNEIFFTRRFSKPWRRGKSPCFELWQLNRQKPYCQTDISAGMIWALLEGFRQP